MSEDRFKYIQFSFVRQNNQHGADVKQINKTNKQAPLL
jgi:hypothetical protein